MYVFMKSFLDIDEFLASFVSTSISPGVLASRCLSVFFQPVYQLACEFIILQIPLQMYSLPSDLSTEWYSWSRFPREHLLLKLKIIHYESEKLLDGVNTDSSEKKWWWTRSDGFHQL